MRKLTKEQVIEKCNKKHNFKFDYSKIIYINSETEMEIICPIHGSFWQNLNNHLSKKHGCNLCSPTLGAKLTQKQFINKCKLKHKNKYDYSKVIFNGVKRKIIIICLEHGDFEQIAEKHFMYGCAACAGNKRKTQFEFINQANVIHNNYYIYNKVIYFSSTKEVIITCPKHGDFLQIAKNHLLGKGCIKCSCGNTSNIEHIWLDQLNIPNDKLHRNVHIKVNGRRFVVDGYLPHSNIIYEFLGDYWHGNPALYDLIKTNLVVKKSFGELLNKTKEKIQFLRKYGFKVICIWESRFRKKMYGKKSCNS